MALVLAGRYDEELFTTAGAALLGATALVRRTDGTTATLYTDQTKTTARPNPLPVDALGNLVFFADPGDYDIVVTPQGGSAQAARRVQAPLHPLEPIASHPDVAAHDALGLATEAELTAHAAGPHGGASDHPDVLAHRALGLITEADLPDIGDAADLQLRSEKGQPSGYAGLGSDGKVPPGQLPPADGGATAPLDILELAARGVAMQADIGATSAHEHTVAEIDATGSPGSTTFLRGDGTWAAATGSHPDLATHDGLGLATDAALAAHAGDGGLHSGGSGASSARNLDYDDTATRVGADNAQHAIEAVQADAQARLASHDRSRYGAHGIVDFGLVSGAFNRGPSSARPSTSTRPVGYQWFDTDLMRPIWCVGLTWAFADGSPA